MGLPLDLSFRFDWWFARLPRSPLEDGRVEHCVLRPTHGARRVVEELSVTPELGIDGDRWRDDAQRKPGSQVSLINAHVLRSIAGDDPERMALAGDNLVVDLDLSEPNLPAGTTLAIGDCVLEVSSEPHRPCRKFHERFGVLAVKRVVRANAGGRRARGVMTRCVRAGTIRTGDPIRVRRPASGA